MKKYKFVIVAVSEVNDESLSEEDLMSDMAESVHIPDWSGELTVGVVKMEKLED